VTSAFGGQRSIQLSYGCSSARASSGRAADRPVLILDPARRSNGFVSFWTRLDQARAPGRGRFWRRLRGPVDKRGGGLFLKKKDLQVIGPTVSCVDRAKAGTMHRSPMTDPDKTPCRNLVLVLGDQLTPGVSSLARADRERDRVLMVEVMEEATYVRHHKKKIAFLFAAMRHFADELRDGGWRVDYVRLDDDGNTGSFRGEVERAVRRLSPERVLVTEPGEWRVYEDMRAWPDTLGRPVDILCDTRFLCSPADFRAWASDRRQLRMEYFYREMRKQTGLLMDGDKPAGGKWNYDADNRKPAKADLFMPEPLRFEPDSITREVLDLVAGRFADHIGELEPFWFAVTREQAEDALSIVFWMTRLPNFGTYQDAMLRGEKVSVITRCISAYLNAGLLDPLDCLPPKVEEAYGADGRAPLNAAEGFIRQILGWREYVRGIYWLKMPGLRARRMHLKGLGPLTRHSYWTGETSG
jgi:deoxyribodipyrimidine photolyase-related protein